MQYSYKGYALLYTIFFCIVGTKVLLVKRKKEPYRNQWNGLGGKIEDGESPEESVKRELAEETGLEVGQARMRYSGIITWDVGVITKKAGMYAFIFFFPTEVLFKQSRTREGLLEWKELDWIIQNDSQEIAENIKFFLPEMIQTTKPMHYHCEYFNKENKDELTRFEVKELDPSMLDSVLAFPKRRSSRKMSFILRMNEVNREV